MVDYSRIGLDSGLPFGIIGGGQLGKMTAQSAATLGLSPLLLADNGRDTPAGACVEKAWEAGKNWDRRDEIGEFAKHLAGGVAICEFESIPLEILSFLELQGVQLKPRSNVWRVAQDRVLEKELAERLGFPVPLYTEFHAGAKVLDDFPWPARLKVRGGGYDGHGQVRVENFEEALQAWNQNLSCEPCILEEQVAFALEISVIVARDEEGNVQVYGPIENIHRDGILHVSIFPARLIGFKYDLEDGTNMVRKQAIVMATQMAEELGVVGLLAVEMFVLPNGKVLFNELAPRPHNSGHWTIDACRFSQFDNLVRAACGLTLGNRCGAPVVMLNLLGGEGYESLVRQVLTDGTPGLHQPHWYGKQFESGRVRKHGHVTFVRGMGIEDVRHPAFMEAVVPGLK